MSKAEKQSPFYYEGQLPEAGAKIVIQFHPECNLAEIKLIKGEKSVSLSMINLDPNRCSLDMIDNAARETRHYGVKLESIIDHDGEVLYLSNK